MNATVKPETLTDGSIVFNVVDENGDNLFCPATRAEAEKIAKNINLTSQFILAMEMKA